jgi:carboxyl-terminal processing protease
MERALAYAKESGKTQLVLDLRNNGGGSMEILEKIASLVIDGDGSQIKLVSAVGKNETTHYNTDRDRFDGFIKKISVIANENSASASECLMGAMLYHYGEKYKTAEKEEDKAKYNNTDCTVFGFGRLVIVKNKNGVAKTYGKGIMQTTYQLSSGGALKLTTARLMWPDHSRWHEGTSIHGIGILPKVAVQGANPNDSANAVIDSLALARAIATLDEGAIILDPVINP